MPVVETFLDVPAVLKIARFEARAVSAVAVSESEFTYSPQAQEWAGQRWEFSVTTPVMTRANFDQCLAWLLDLQQAGRKCMFGDPMGTTPKGAALGTPLVNGAHSAGVSVLSIKGWTPNTAEVLKAGDYFQANNYLYRILSTEDAQSDGIASFDIWPRLRTSLGDGAEIIITNPKGKFRLGKYETGWSADPNKLVGLGFTLIEDVP